MICFTAVGLTARQGRVIRRAAGQVQKCVYLPADRTCHWAQVHVAEVELGAIRVIADVAGVRGSISRPESALPGR